MSLFSAFVGNELKWGMWQIPWTVNFLKSHNLKSCILYAFYFYNHTIKSVYVVNCSFALQFTFDLNKRIAKCMILSKFSAKICRSNEWYSWMCHILMLACKLFGTSFHKAVKLSFNIAYSLNIISQPLYRTKYRSTCGKIVMLTIPWYISTDITHDMYVCLVHRMKTLAGGTI